MNSLYLRLLLPLGVIFLLGMAAAWAIALTLLTNVIDRRLDAQLGNATSILAEGTFPFSEDLIARLDRLIEARIALLDGRGRLALSTGDEAANRALAGLGATGETADGADADFTTLQADGSAWRVAVRQLPTLRDDRYRYVVAAAPLEDTRGVVRESALLLAAAILVAGTLLALLAGYFIRSITRPVTKLAGMAGRIADGERGVSSDIDERNEIGVLARALNEMAAKLEGYEDEIAETSRMAGLGHLATRVAHEVRNPLTAMKMQLQLLEERTTPEDAGRVRAVLEEVRRLELIVESSLAVGGGQAVNPKPTDLGALILDVAALLAPSFAHRNIRLATDIGALPSSALDADRIKQVLLNLLNNAADALPDGGDVVVSAGLRDGDTVEIVIEDSGPGLPEEGAAGPAAKPFGLGLGLRISQEIITAHEGRIVAGESRLLGGARFVIELPVTIMAALEH